jgi:hypothetical protein
MIIILRLSWATVRRASAMWTRRSSARLTLGLVVALAACTSMPTSPQAEGKTAMNVEQIKEALVGEWVSIAPELRPSASKNPDGTLKPFYLKREFKYLGGDRFELTIVNTADPNGAVPLAQIFIRGHMLWRGPHPIAAGAQKVDFVADEAYAVTPLNPGFADLLNKVAGKGYATWEAGAAQSIFGKSFAPFGLVEGETSWSTTGVPEPRHAVLGRSQHRRSRLRQGREPADQPADPAGSQAIDAARKTRAAHPAASAVAAGGRGHRPTWTGTPPPSRSAPRLLAAARRRPSGCPALR